MNREELSSRVRYDWAGGRRRDGKSQDRTQSSTLCLVPAHVLIVNYFGIPLSGSVSSWARAEFAPLKKHGPNDGILLLSDMIFPGGITVGELGLDHFLLDRHIDVTIVALAMTVIEWNEQHRGKSNFLRGN
jgi:hypothetical protein